jgi:integrase
LSIITFKTYKMAIVKFYIRDPKAKSKTSIMLSFTYSGNRIRISTGEQIYPSHWNNKAQRVREVMDEPDACEINNKLKGLTSLVTDVYQNYLRDAVIPSPKELTQEIENQRIHPSLQNNNKEFWELFDEFVEYKKKQYGDVRDYDKSLRKHLENGEKLWKKPLTFASLKLKDKGLIEILDDYLTNDAINSKGEKGLTVNTVGKQFKNLKVFLNWAFSNEYVTKFDITHIVTKTEEVDAIYLKKGEVDAIFNLDDLTEKDSLIRDLFIIGVETGLRFSDFIRIKPEYIADNKLTINPIKTISTQNNRVQIPISSKFRAILNKRNGIPPIYDRELTEFNKTVRELAKKAGINTEVVIYRKIGGKHIETVYKKYELVSSHTCRRTFCTLKFLGKMPANVIMKFTGHKTERSFLRYLKLGNEEVCEQYNHLFD